MSSGTTLVLLSCDHADAHVAHDDRCAAVHVAHDDKDTVDLLGQQIRQTKDTIAGFVRHPLSAATENLLVPAVLTMLRGLRSKREQG